MLLYDFFHHLRAFLDRFGAGIRDFSHLADKAIHLILRLSILAEGFTVDAVFMLRNQQHIAAETCGGAHALADRDFRRAGRLDDRERDSR